MKLFSALPLLAAVATVAGAHSEGGSKGMGSAPSSEGGSSYTGSEGGSKGMGSEGGSKGMGSSSMAMGPTDPFTATFVSFEVDISISAHLPGICPSHLRLQKLG